MKRSGARGEGQFQEVTWDEAIAELLSHLDALDGDQKSLAFITGARTGHRQAVVEQFLSKFGASAPIAYELFGDDVLRRANALSFGHEQLPTFDLEALALRPQFRRRFSRHMEFAGGAGARVRRAAAGASRHPRHLRPGRVAHDDDRRERRRVDSRDTGYGRRARTRSRARDSRAQAAAVGRRRPRRQPHPRLVGWPAGFRAGRGRKNHRRRREADRTAGARLRERCAPRSRSSAVRRSRTRTALFTALAVNALNAARRQRSVSREACSSRRSGRPGLQADRACRQSLDAFAPRAGRQPVRRSRAARRRESGVHRAVRVEGARGAREGAVHRELWQLPRRHEQPGRSDSSGSFVSRVVGRWGAGVGLDRRRGERRRARDASTARHARNGRRAPRRGRQKLHKAAWPAVGHLRRDDQGDLRRDRRGRLVGRTEAGRLVGRTSAFADSFARDKAAAAAADAARKPASHLHLRRSAVRRRCRPVSVSLPAVQVAAVPRRFARASALVAGTARPDDVGDVEQLDRNQSKDRGQTRHCAQGDIVEITSAHGAI